MRRIFEDLVLVWVWAITFSLGLGMGFIWSHFWISTTWTSLALYPYVVTYYYIYAWISKYHVISVDFFGPNHQVALIGEDDISYPPTLDALGDFCGLTLDALGDFCGLYWSNDPFQVPNHWVTLIGEDDMSCPSPLMPWRIFAG